MNGPTVSKFPPRLSTSARRLPSVLPGPVSAKRSTTKLETERTNPGYAMLTGPSRKWERRIVPGFDGVRLLSSWLSHGGR
jgi:hypothetical protein